MKKPPLVDPELTCTARLEKQAQSIEMAVRLGHEFTGGELLRFKDGSDPGEPWRCAILSGAFYAFRTLGIPRQHVCVDRFAPTRLRLAYVDPGAVDDAELSDMSVVAECVALAVSALAKRELDISLEGWKFTCETGSTKHRPIRTHTPTAKRKRGVRVGAK